MPGYASLRNESRGTWFGYTLAHKLALHAHEFHLEDILKRVRQLLSTNTQQNIFLISKCFF